MSPKQRAVFALLAVAIYVTNVAVGAGAVTLMTISGTVSDVINRPIVGATVSDGRQSVLTDAAGNYRLEESSVGTFTIRVSKVGINAPAPRSVSPVDAVNPVNFTVTYVTSGTVTPAAFSSATDKTLSLEATTYAPPETACVAFKDVASGTTVPLTFQPPANGNGSSRWTGSFLVTAGKADGAYAWQASTTNCSSTVLSNVFSNSYLIDSVAPTLIPVSPVDGGNAFTTALRFAADARDELSGIKSNSASITLRDDSASPPSTDTVPAIYTLSGNSIGSTGTTPLTTDHSYTATLSVADNAGNVTTKTVEFMATAFSVASPPKAAVPTTTADSGGTTCTLGQCEWIFDELPLTVEGYDAVLSNTKHAGYGALSAKTSLASATVTYTVGVLPVTRNLSEVVADANVLRDRHVSQQLFSLRPNTPNQSVHVEPIGVAISEPIKVLLPYGVSNVQLEMDLTSAGIVPGLPPCRMEGDVYTCDPVPSPVPSLHQDFCKKVGVLSSAVSVCNPDALYYFISDQESVNLVQWELAQAQYTAADIGPECDAVCRAAISEPTNPVFNSNILTAAILDPSYKGWLDPFAAINYRTNPSTELHPNDMQNDVYSDVQYPQTYPAVLTSHFPAMCYYSLACNRAAAEEYGTVEAVETTSSSSTAGQAETCVDSSGREVSASGPKCRQHIKLRMANYGGQDPAQDNREQLFTTQVTMSVGMKNATWDSIGMSWSKPQNQSWHARYSGSTYKGGNWTRRREILVDDGGQWNEDVDSYCHKESEITYWSLNSDGNNSMEYGLNAELTGYGRRLWQGKDQGVACQRDQQSGWSRPWSLRTRLVSGSIWITLYEDEDLSPNPHDDPPGHGNFIGEFSHWTKDVTWSFSFGVPPSLSVTPDPYSHKSFEMFTVIHDFWY